MLRRYAPMKQSRGTVIPPQMKVDVFTRDGGCVGFLLSFPGECAGGLEPDHVRASHGIGMKSRTEPDNLVSLCGSHHRWKTDNGRKARPLLLAYLATLEGDHPHVDPTPGCEKCIAVFG
jgi:5-methylcytosine-specific restriction endonuclease McrA